MLGRLRTWDLATAATMSSMVPDTFDAYCIVWHRTTATRDTTPAPRCGRGTLSPDTCADLAKRLEPFAVTDHWVLTLWDGYGWQPELTAPRVEIPHRSLILFEGSPRDVCRIDLPTVGFQSPTLWWPQSCEWLVRTDVDSDYSVVAGSRDCIDHIVNSPRLHTQRADISTDLETLEPPDQW